MKVLKRLWFILLFAVIVFSGCLFFDLLPIDYMEFLYIGFIISLIAFLIISYIYENKKVKIYGYDDKKISRLLIINILLLVLYYILYVSSNVLKTNVSNIVKYIVFGYENLYKILLVPFFCTKYIPYFSRGKVWLKIVGIVLLIILFYFFIIVSNDSVVEVCI